MQILTTSHSNMTQNIEQVDGLRAAREILLAEMQKTPAWHERYKKISDIVAEIEDLMGIH